MHEHTSVLQQLQNLLPLSEFQSFVRQHGGADRYVKRLTCKNQLTLLLYAQATGKDSLRDIETSLKIHGNQWYHLGLETAARSTLARANEKRPYHIYESLFYELLKKCHHFSSGTASFSFENALYALDATIISLCLSLFPWAKFRTEKGSPLRGVHNSTPLLKAFGFSEWHRKKPPVGFLGALDGGTDFGLCRFCSMKVS